MIYTKDAAFPYPVLSRTSSSYQENYFNFNVDGVKEYKDCYVFSLAYEISSHFIETLLLERKAALILIVQSGDNYFEKLNYEQKEVCLKKNRLALSKRTKLQLHIQTLEDINFSKAEDLSFFYQEYKGEIEVKRHSLLGYSDEVVFEGSDVKPLEIFEQSIREDMALPFKVELKSETIMLVFKDRKESLEIDNVKKSLRNLYLYIGLNRALTDFIETYGKDEDFIDLESISIPENGLHIKLRDLMLSKNIIEVNPEKMDELIQTISNGIVEKYTDSVREMAGNGN